MRLKWVLLSGVAAFGASMAFAAQAQDGGSRGSQLEEVVVTGTRQAEQLRDFAGSISLVKSDDVTVVGSTHHSEIMNRAPGAMMPRSLMPNSLAGRPVIL